MRQLENETSQKFFSVVDSKSVFFGYLIFTAKVRIVENLKETVSLIKKTVSK